MPESYWIRPLPMVWRKLTHNDVVSMLGVVGRDEVTALLGATAEGSAAKVMDISGQLTERNSDFADVLARVS